eukprot:scaffold20989_cov108-Isochrysis_galbana.AAC.6
MGSRAGCVSIEWATEGVLESLALSDRVVWLPVQLWFLSGGRACAHAFAWLLVSGAREYPQAPLDVAEGETPERGKGVRCACGGGACTYRLVGCWGVARPLGEGQIVVLHRGHDVGERRCLPTVARRVRNPHRSFLTSLD